MLNVLTKFAATGLGDSKELNQEMDQLQKELAGVNFQLNLTEGNHFVELLNQLPKLLKRSK